MKIEAVKPSHSTDEEAEYFKAIENVINQMGASVIIGFDSALTGSHQASNLTLGEFLIRFGNVYGLPPDLAETLAKIPTSLVPKILDMDPANLKNRFTLVLDDDK